MICAEKLSFFSPQYSTNIRKKRSCGKHPGLFLHADYSVMIKGLEKVGETQFLRLWKKKAVRLLFLGNKKYKK